MEKDWYETKFKDTNEPYRYTVAHWCATEARFRNHLKKIKKDDADRLVFLENMLVRITQQDVVYRRYLNPSHRSYIPDFGVYMKIPGAKGGVEYRSLSRQLVLFCVERRKAWRLLQSKSGVENKEYKAQRSILADVDAGKISFEILFTRAEELMKERVSALTPAPAVAAARAAVPGPAAADSAPARAVVPIPAAPKPQAEVAKQPPSTPMQAAPAPKSWKAPSIGDGADDVIDMGICPLCEETLKLAYPDAVDVGGQIIHATCAAKAMERPA